jgi:hypothetical protein
MRNRTWLIVAVVASGGCIGSRAWAAEASAEPVAEPRKPDAAADRGATAEPGAQLDVEGLYGAPPRKRAASAESAVSPAGSPPPAPAPQPAAAHPNKGATGTGNFMDTRLTWTLGDDDVLHATGLAYPLSPNVSIGDRPQYRLFFDNLNSRFSGRENITHLVMYKKLPGFIGNLDTEAALVLRVDLAQLATGTGNLNAAFYDAGSNLRLMYVTRRGDGAKVKDQGADLTLFPLDTDRFRLGYLYDISWGGSAAYINQSIFPRIRGGAPGLKLGFTGDGFNVFAGLKTASITQVTQVMAPGTNEVETIKIAETNYGVLGGGGVDFTDNVRLDVGGGYFQQGTFELPDVFGKRVYTYGASGRLVVHDGMPVPASVDFLLYRNDPNAPMLLFKPESYRAGELAWAVSAEGSRLEQNLKDYDVPGATRLQHGNAGAMQAVLKAGYARASLTGIFRDLPFVMRSQPGYIPFQTLPADARTESEMFFATAADYHLPGLKLTPGIGGGIKFPSTFSSVSASQFGAIARTVVVREQGNIAILPNGKGRVPIVQARLSLRWDISEMMSAVLWAQLIHDNNATFVERDPSEGTLTLRVFVKPDFVGFGSSFQARF